MLGRTMTDPLDEIVTLRLRRRAIRDVLLHEIERFETTVAGYDRTGMSMGIEHLRETTQNLTDVMYQIQRRLHEEET